MIPICFSDPQSDGRVKYPLSVCLFGHFLNFKSNFESKVLLKTDAWNFSDFFHEV